MNSPLALAVHGGAGTISRDQMTPELERQYRDALQQIIETGYDVLRHGGLALDAVEAAVRALEDCPMPARAPFSLTTAATKWTLP